MGVLRAKVGDAWVDIAVGAPGVGVPPGGNTNQILAKDTNADYDTEWVNPPAGLITNYTHTQGAVAATWIVEHHLGFFPSVIVIDSGGSVVEGDIAYIDTNTLTLQFSGAFSGTAYLS